MIKQDKWSGQSWRYVDKEWKEITDAKHDWEKIDIALMDALRIQKAGPERANAINLLRGKAPVFDGLSDNELLERIKFVYSKEILVNLYLQNFLKLEEKSSEEKK